METDIDSIKAFSSKTFVYEGNTCVVIAQAESVSPNVKVPVYDLDSGEIFKLSLLEIARCENGRNTEPQDFQFSRILSSKYANNAQEIVDVLFDD